MNIRKFINLVFLIAIVGVMLFRSTSFGQKIELKDVAKIQMAEREGGASSTESRFELIRQNNTWKIYRTWHTEFNFKINGIATDSTKVFLKDIQAKDLSALLTMIANADTAVAPKHYQLSKDSLVKYTDTVHPSLTRIQKAQFLKALTPTEIKKALIYLSPIFKNPDSGHYAITIIDHANKSFTAKSPKWGYQMYLPWQYGGIKNYDPRILNLFFELTANAKEAAVYQKQLYIDIDIYVYRKYFETRFNWALFKVQNAAAYRVLKNTVTPVKFIVDRHTLSSPYYRQSYVLKSSRLPAYANIYWDFYKPDVANSLDFKRYEDTLARVFKKGNFLFNYLKAQKGAKLYIIKASWNRMNVEKRGAFKDIKKYYPAIASKTVNAMQLLRIAEDDGNLSYWILFDDDVLVLASFTGELKEGYSVKFKGITPDPKAAGPRKHLRSLCLVFDRTGKLLGGTTARVFIGAPF